MPSINCLRNDDDTIATSCRYPVVSADLDGLGLADRWPLGLASSANRPVIDAVLKRAGITDCFAVTVSGEEVAAGKPAPDVYLIATRRLAVDPVDAAAVEDST